MTDIPEDETLIDIMHDAMLEAVDIGNWTKSGARNALSALRAAGYEVVPREPSWAMRVAARDHDSSTRDWYDISPEGCENLGLVLWRKMIEAAAPPARREEV